MRQGLCNDTVSVRPSVCPSVCFIYRPLHAAAAGSLLWARRAGDIDRQRWPLGAAAANASSVTLSADVGSCWKLLSPELPPPRRNSTVSRRVVGRCGCGINRVDCTQHAIATRPASMSAPSGKRKLDRMMVCALNHQPPGPII